mgnify:CR=1 FL=1
MHYVLSKRKEEGGGELERGKLSGQWTLWHENGQKQAEGEFADDRRNGLWTEWNERGEKSSEATFRDGYTVALETPETDSTTEP